MEFAVLGPVEVRRDGLPLTLGGPKQRALLAILLLHANEAVSRDRLIDGLWGAHPPETAQRSLDTYVSRLRSLLGKDRIVTRAPGYGIRVGEGELDLDRFESLVARARAAPDPGVAASALSEALALWRGPALGDLLFEPFAAREAERLEEHRLVALEERIAADLGLGRSAELVPELEALVREHPFRERLLAHLMVALYRAGRQSDALAAYQAGRKRLVDEVGLEPGPDLRKLQHDILEHDPGLESSSEARHAVRVRPTLSRPRLTPAAVAAAMVAAAIAAGIVLGTRGTSASHIASTSRLVGVDASSSRPVPGPDIARSAAAIASGAGSLWLADANAGSVLRVDLTTRSIIDRIPVGGSPAALAVGGGSVWVASVPGESIRRIDPQTGEVTQTIALGGARVAALTFGAGRLWVADVTDNSVLEVDLHSGGVTRTFALHLRPTALAVGDGAIWVAGYDAGAVAQVDLRSGQTLATVRVGNGPAALAIGRGGIWVANALDSTLSRIDPTAGSSIAAIPVGSGPTSVAVAAESIWVANEHSANLSRIDPETNSVTATAHVAGSPTAIAVVGNTIWTAVRPPVQHRGGTLVLLHTRPISIDPSLQADLLPLVSDGLTRDGLVTYNHAPGPAGIQLVPDLAISVPPATDGGTTFTFRLRPDIRYSDGRAVRAADFRRAIERAFRLSSEGAQAFAGIIGAESCGEGACDLLRGIVTDERARTVTFHLRVSDPDVLSTLANPIASPVPAGTPPQNTGFVPIPGTGPYKVARASESEIRYVRNPYFREWSHAARPDGNPDVIIMRFGLTPEQAIWAVQAGRADWSADNIPARLLPALRAQHASRLHHNAIPATDFLQFNTALAPFDDVRVRRALNFAIDRHAIVRLYGGRDLASPTCQILPPGVAGYRRYCPYTRNPDSTGTWTAPNLNEARRLVAASGTRGSSVTVWGWTDDPTLSVGVTRYTADVLRRLGYRTHIRLIPHAVLDHPPSMNIFTKIQLIPAAWGDTANGFFTTWFSCAGINSHGWFCDPSIDNQVRRAQSLKATRPRAAVALWANIDRELVDKAAWAPLIDEGGVDFVSARVHNYQFHPYWGLMADQLWLH